MACSCQKSSQGKPLVSIIIPTYKQANLLPRAIDSVLNQSYKNIEIIVVDDNPPESQERKDTEMQMLKYKNSSQVFYIKHPQNMNGSAARNTGVRNSLGDFVAFLDDDDEYLPNKIETMLQKMLSLSTEWGACYSNYIVKRPNGAILRYSERKEGALLADALMRNLMIAAGSNLFVRKEVFEELHGFDESFQRNQDLEFLVRLLSKYKIAFVPQFGLIVYQQLKKGDKKVNFMDVTFQYLKTFHEAIESLSSEDRERVYHMINLQIFRHKFLGNNDITGAIDMIKSGQVSFIVAVRYISHLLGRALFKTVNGFKL